MEQKQWYLSKTIWGAMIMLLSVVLKSMGVIELSQAEQDSLVTMLYNVAYSISEMVGFVLVIWGRVTAKKEIKV